MTEKEQPVLFVFIIVTIVWFIICPLSLSNVKTLFCMPFHGNIFKYFSYLQPLSNNVLHRRAGTRTRTATIKSNAVKMGKLTKEEEI